MALRIMARALQCFVIATAWRGGFGLVRFPSPLSPDATTFVEASIGFLNASEHFDKRIRTVFVEHDVGDDLNEALARPPCPQSGRFITQLLEMIVEDFDFHSATGAALVAAISEVESAASTGSEADVQKRALIVLSAFSRNIATLYAARQARVALKSLDTEIANQLRAALVSRQGELERTMQHALPQLFNFGAQFAPAVHQLPLDELWQRVKRAETDLRLLMKDSATRELVQSSRGRLLELDWPALAIAHDLPQKSRIRMDASGSVTKDTRIDLGFDHEGKRVFMPMVGLGTGYSDCVHGLQLDGSNLSNTKCVTTLPAGWVSKLSLVDTAALYGTESSVGQALQESSRPRSEMFVMTKLPVQATWPLLHISKGIDLFEHQLRSLRMPYVDALLLHHDGFNVSEWKSLEEAFETGKTRVIGVSSPDSARESQKCVDEGVCKHSATLAQGDWTPCGLQIPSEVPPGITMVAHSGVWSCGQEPHVASIAQQKGVAPAAVAIRWALQTGVPTLVQTKDQHHLQSDLTALDIQLSEKEMGLLNLLPTLYRINGGTHTSVLKAMV